MAADDPRRLDDADFRHLLAAAASDRARLVVRLAGEAGLRPGEMTALSPEDVETHDDGEETHYFAAVGTGDRTRDAYLPPELGETLLAYAPADADGGTPVFSVSARRLQMLVSEVASRAAAETGDDELAAVSTRDLRRYFARTLLLDDGLDPRVVTAIGGWRSLESVLDLLADPGRDAIVEAFRSAAASTEGAADYANKDQSISHGAGAAETGARLERLGETVVTLGRNLEHATTREEIESIACDVLTDPYQHAWIAADHVGGIDLLADQGLPVDSLPATLHDLVSRARESESAVVESVEADGLQADGLQAETTTVVAVPITHDGTTYGVLGIGVSVPEAALSTLEPALLADIARRLGQAIAAVERQRLLHADTVVQLSLVVTDRNDFFVRLSEDHGCSLTLTGIVPGEDGSLLTFVWVEGASPDAAFEEAARAASVSNARLIRNGDDGALLEFVLTTESPLHRLLDHSGSVTELEVEDGEATVTAEFVPDIDVRDIIESVTDAYPATEMVAKREVERTVRTDNEFSDTLASTLTPKQRSALQAAHHAGYFDWPRGSTAEELADSLGVTSPTFHNHLRRAQQKLLSTFLDGVDS